MFQPGASGCRSLAATAQRHRHEGAEDRGGAGQRAGARPGQAHVHRGDRLVHNLEELWAEAERLAGRPIDPLDPRYMGDD